MRAELKNCEVLAMYDVRGIQAYIFKSNVAKEIVGASELVRQIITEGLDAYIKTLPCEKSKNYLTEWKDDDPEAFLKDSSVEMQIMFIGGGNAYVLFRRGEECQNVNKFLAEYILNRTYSLSLAVAVVKKTENYSEDYNAINEEMRRIKASMPLSMPMGAMPFMAVDSVTGYPLTEKTREEYLCTEAKLKRDAFPETEDEKIFDNMVTEKGDSSTLAVFHIDGNSMGKKIKDKMQKIHTYGEAVRTMRTLSIDISDTFLETVGETKQYIDSIAPRVKKDTSHKLYREIIAAGDDITFVCNAKVAIPAVEFFLRHISDSGEFSACGGIAFFNSHFPFSDAYQVAEESCSMAKARAKEKENRGAEDKIGNFLDFQICTNINASDLKSYRARLYQTEGELFLARPYYVDTPDDKVLNQKNEKYNISRLHYWENYFAIMPRNKAKQLREVIPMGKNEIKRELSFLRSRGYQEFKNLDEYKVWYDALEIMDWHIKEEQNENNDRTSE